MDADITKFLAWGESLPSVFACAMAATAEGDGRTCVAKRNVAAGEVVAAIPARAVLTVATALRHATGQRIREYARDEGRDVSARSVLFCYMIHCRHTPSEYHHAYCLHCLPPTYDDPLWWDDGSRAELLAGTSLLRDSATHL